MEKTTVEDQPPPIPRRAKISIKHQRYSDREGQDQSSTPEPRQQLEYVNVNELRVIASSPSNDSLQKSLPPVPPHRTNNSNVSLKSQQQHILSSSEKQLSDNHDCGDVRVANEGYNDCSLTPQDDYEYDEVGFEADECYDQDEDDDYDDSGLQSQRHDEDHEQISHDLVDLSRESMVPLHELIAYYQYIQQGSSSSDHDQEDSSSAAVSRQSSNASQQTTRESALKDITKIDINQQLLIAEQKLDCMHLNSSKDLGGHKGQEEPLVQSRKVPQILVEQHQSATSEEDCELHQNLSTVNQQHIAPLATKIVKPTDKQRVRANVVLELINSERDFVKHLKDVVEGYLYPARRHPEIFTGERINTIFANIEQLYRFQKNFLDSLEQTINWQDLAASQVGKCFLDYEKGFSVYHEYCNNHPNATSELQDLYTKARFVKFFEACRVLQNMIDISLDGFLLTPIQKICKYPLQLKELLKNTDEQHPDYKFVSDALETMRNCANLANERKRRIEALADVMSFQEKLENWFGPKLSDSSSILIHSGEVMKMNTSNAWSQGVQLYLFDHLLLYAKRDTLLKRSQLILKGRICMDSVTEISDADEYKPRRSFKIFCSEQQKWFVFITRTEKDKDDWIQAFERERNLVEADENEGFRITDREIGIARRTLQHRKHSRSARYRHKHRPDTAIVDQIDLDDANMIMNRTLSLPSCIHPSHVMNFVKDSKVVAKSAKATPGPHQQSPNSPSSRPRSPGAHPNQNTNQFNNNPLLTDDLEKTTAPSVNWFKKMGSKKLSKSQVYNVNDTIPTGLNAAAKLVVGSSSPGSTLASIVGASQQPAAQLTAAQIITSDKAAIKYEELEKRHREHMSSEEQARLYRLNNDLPPPPSMFSQPHHQFASRPSTTAPGRRISGAHQAPYQQQQSYNLLASQKSTSNLASGGHSPSDQLQGSNHEQNQRLETRESRQQLPDPKSSFEATLVLSSGRVVQVREDTV